MSSKRSFPLEAIVLFPLLGPPALAFAGACLYAVILTILLVAPAALIAAPVYFVFWAKLAYAALWVPGLIAGVLYAVAVRLFAPPDLTTALAAGAVSAVGYGTGVWLFGNGELNKSNSQLIVIGTIIGAAQAAPGWWASHASRQFFISRQGRKGP